jgi:hypothetical protein
MIAWSLAFDVKDPPTDLVKKGRRSTNLQNERKKETA